jgi:hypothetical protein
MIRAVFVGIGAVATGRGSRRQQAIHQREAKKQDNGKIVKKGNTGARPRDGTSRVDLEMYYVVVVTIRVSPTKSRGGTGDKGR